MNYHFPQGDFLSRRVLAFSGIAAFHLLIAYLLLTALVQAPQLKNDKPMEGFVIPTADPPPVEKEPDFRPPDHTGRIEVPPLDPVALPQSSSPMVTVVSERPTGGNAVTAPAAVPVRVVGVNQLPNSEDYYPPDMRRQNIEGATNVRVCVDAQGARAGDPRIEDSSGFPHLDEGALNVVRHGRFAKSLQGDTPVGNCFRFRVTFKIPKK